MIRGRQGGRVSPENRSEKKGEKNGPNPGGSGTRRLTGRPPGHPRKTPSLREALASAAADIGGTLILWNAGLGPDDGLRREMKAVFVSCLRAGFEPGRREVGAMGLWAGCRHHAIQVIRKGCEARPAASLRVSAADIEATIPLTPPEWWRLLARKAEKRA